MRADFPVVLDACVLAEVAVSDLILRLSEEPRLLLPRWTEEIWAEVRRTLIGKLGWDEAIADGRIEAATRSFPEAMVSGYDHLVPLCENHPDDRHVLAAAIHSKTETIVTFNGKHFRPEALEPWGIFAVHPRDHLKVLYELDPAVVVSALSSMSQKAGKTLPELLGRLAWSLRGFAEHVADALALELPEIAPDDWRR